MATTDDDRERVSPAYRLIHHYREQATAAVQRYNEARVRGDVDERVQLDLATAALNYYNVLHEHRDEAALSEPWGERGIQWLEQAAQQSVVVEESLPRSNGATAASTKPKLLAVDPEAIKQTILELNDIAKELGLSIRIEESTPRTEITDEMIEEVDEWRKQNLE